MDVCDMLILLLVSCCVDCCCTDTSGALPVTSISISKLYLKSVAIVYQVLVAKSICSESYI